jgi:hypothetical protein
VSAGSQVTLRALGAVPGEPVDLFVSPGPAGVGPCPPYLGGRCFSLGAPVVHAGTAPANAAGTAALVYVVPAGVPAGRPVTFQAVALRGGAADLTQTITRVVQ